jgi:hypothetical protein
MKDDRRDDENRRYEGKKDGEKAASAHTISIISESSSPEQGGG